ncbi:MAG: respiratory nitrate reductase subunit gamma [Quinella sp. 3Q1]|nr:respiratory nitrate reductase subunit gamma [Quinella sp. 3Q1]MBR3050250.1 respiratory nitrate reductase subunit gamma [Selenomonadaceae bacterium]MBR6888629.1 respiratory nitrate reductase subunit gamma [Selenomonadaceae bacterium]
MSGFFWGALPYIAFAVLILGTAYRYWTGERGWSTKSSQFLAKDSLKVPIWLFHLGLLMAFGGHVIGILIPKSLTDGVGISEHLYHIIALGGGIPAGILFLGGFFLLMRRRFDNPRMKVNTSTSDGVIYFVLFLALITGFGGTLLNAVGLLGDEFNYRECISPWFRSVLAMNPDVSLMSDAPIIFKCHVLCAMATIIIFPFTRLVHCLSFPFEYFMRSNIIYRRK